MKYRNEQKYLCDQRDKAIIESRLKLLMGADIHSDEKNSYLIKSIYFDDIYNTLFTENESGVDERSKFRIRAYNNDDSVIKMEIKNKKNGFTNKESCSISREKFDSIIFNNDYKIEKGQSPVYNRFCIMNKERLLRPICVVGYQRTAYVLKEGNVRITFDEDIYASNDIDKFFEVGHRIPVLPTGEFILEVKYDEFLPRHIQHALGIGTLSQTAFSKYYMGRAALNKIPQKNIQKQMELIK